jgi:hypothetical protein
MGKQAAVVLYVLALVAVVVGVDIRMTECRANCHRQSSDGVGSAA